MLKWTGCGEAVCCKGRKQREGWANKSTGIMKLSAYDRQRCILLIAFVQNRRAAGCSRQKKKGEKGKICALQLNRVSSRRDSLDRRKADKVDRTRRRRGKQRKIDVNTRYSGPRDTRE